MRNFSIIVLCFFLSIGLIQQGICSSAPEIKKKSPIIRKALLMSNDKDQEKKKNREAEDTLKALKNIGALSKSSRISKVLNMSGETALAAKQIIFTSDENHRPYVIKRFNSSDGFIKEQKELDNVNLNICPKIIELESKFEWHELGWTYKFPTITSGKAFPRIDKIGVIVLEMGVGETLYDRFVEKLSTIPDQEIIEVFTPIGEQSGCLDREFYKHYQQILFHGDAHARNFTFDDFTKILYWIDTTGMFLSSKKSRGKPIVTGISKLEFLFQISGSKERNDQLDEWLKKANKFRDDAKVADISSLTPAIKTGLAADLENIKRARKKDYLAIESFRNGYVSMNPEQEADCNAEINQLFNTFEATIVENKIKEYNKLVTESSQNP